MSPLAELGRACVGLLELTALPSIDRDLWVPALQEADAVLVGGGDPLAMFPHLDHPAMPDHSTSHAERWASRLAVPSYLMDDETAIRVVDGEVTVISEGSWRLVQDL